MSSQPVVHILTTRTCRWTLRPSVALREKGVPFELVDVMEDGRKAPWFVASTPFGKTPVLRHGERSLPESLVICEYIEETFGGRALLPAEPLSRAWDRVWLRFCDDTLIKALYNIVRAAAAEQRELAVAALLDEGRRVDVYWPNRAGRYWRGEELTLVDICYYTFFEALERTGKDVREAFVDACPRLGKWREVLLADGAFSRAALELDALGN